MTSETTKRKEVYGYSVEYHRYKNIHGQNLLNIVVHYKGKFLDFIAYADGEQLSI